MTFRELHQQEKPLLIGNVWDAQSTKIATELNFQAIGTSSAAIASMMGYADGEEMSFPELETMVKAIRRSTHLPLSVDLEAGYSRNPEVIADHVGKLVSIGVVGINIEDSLMGDGRYLIDAEDFAVTVVGLGEQLKLREIEVFINVRTDPFLLGHPNALEETLKRVRIYENAGADGIFIPCIERESDISEVVGSIALPVNVMCMPKLPNFQTLGELGVKRISMGNFLFSKMYSSFELLAQQVLNLGSFKPIF